MNDDSGQACDKDDATDPSGQYIGLYLMCRMLIHAESKEDLLLLESEPLPTDIRTCGSDECLCAERGTVLRDEDLHAAQICQYANHTDFAQVREFLKGFCGMSPASEREVTEGSFTMRKPGCCWKFRVTFCDSAPRPCIKIEHETADDAGKGAGYRGISKRV